MLVDAHLHIYDLVEILHFQKDGIDKLAKSLKEILFCASSHNIEEFFYTEKFCLENKLKGFFSFGIHPQNPILDELENLEKLLSKKQIQIIGEMGFDLFDEKNKANFKSQKEVWNIQIELALKHNVPVILHLRKSNHLIFQNLKSLKKLKAVIFHGWSGSTIEAHSILKAGVNAFFSIGKALLRGQKTVYQMVNSFPIERLLTETDAPYMKLKNEVFSKPSDIKKVTRKITEIRFKSDLVENEKAIILPQLQKNFFQCLQNT